MEQFTNYQKPEIHHKFWQHPLLVVLAALMAAVLGCNFVNITPPAAPTPEPTRTPFPTFTATPEGLGVVIVQTPPDKQGAGVFVLDPAEGVGAIITRLPTSLPATPIAGVAISATVEGGSTDQAGAPTLAPPLDTPTPLPTDTPTSTPLPTDTATPTQSPTPTIVPSPFIVAEGGVVSLREGPGVEYPLIALLDGNIPVPVTGRNPEGTWLQLCCVNGGSLWVAAGHVQIQNDLASVPLVMTGPAPSPTPTDTPTSTPLATPTATATRYPFELAIGPQFFPADPAKSGDEDEIIMIWVKLFVGSLQTPFGCIREGEPLPPNKEAPAEGYFLKATFNGLERRSTAEIKPSTGGTWFACSMAPGGAGNRVEYNYKFEYRVPDPKSPEFLAQWNRDNPPVNGTPVPTPANNCAGLGTGKWSIHVVDGTGRQLSDPITFDTAGCNIHEVYVGWVRTR